MRMRNFIKIITLVVASLCWGALPIWADDAFGMAGAPIPNSAPAENFNASQTSSIASVASDAVASDTVAAASQNSSSPILHHVGLNLRAGYLFPTHEFFRGNNRLGHSLNKTASVHLQYAFSFPQDSYFGKVYPSAYQGVGLAVNTFFDPGELGMPVALYLFQGADMARFSDKLSLGYEWNFGASLGWHPYRELAPKQNNFNHVVGSHVNAYINAGILLKWRPIPNLSIVAGLEATHFSNGNTKYPNAGVNTAGGRFGVVWDFSAGRFPLVVNRLTEPQTAGEDKKRFLDRMSVDAIVYGAGRSKGMMWQGNPYIISGTFGILGLNISPLYRINRYFRAGISLDVQYDESANLENYIAGNTLTDGQDDLRFYRPPLREQVTGGLSLRAELVMPIFCVNIGFGHNVLYKGDDLDGFYQIAALKINVTRHAFLHVGYKLSKFHDPNNLMLGLGWRFGRSGW